MHVLFVCTGNICRSPIAERLAVAHSQRPDFAGLTFSSAGTRAVVGHPLHPTAAQILLELGGEPSHFAARQMTSAMAADADLILTMTKAHRAAVLDIAPRQLHRTFVLSEAARLVSDCNARTPAQLAEFRSRLRADDVIDVPDPIGRDESFHRQVGEQIRRLLPRIIELCRTT